MSIKVDAKGFEKFRKYLNKISSTKAFNDLKVDIKSYLIRSTVKKIQTGNIRGNKTLSPVTIANKGSSKVLQDTGRLMRSIRGYVGRKSVYVGSNLKYAAIHNQRGTIKPVKAKHLYIPAFREVNSRYGANTNGVAAAMSRMKKDGWSLWHTPRAVLGKRKQDTKARVVFFKKKSVDIPKREYLYLTNQDKEEMTQLAINVWKGAN